MTVAKTSKNDSVQPQLETVSASEKHQYARMVYVESHKGLMYTIGVSGVLAGILLSAELLEVDQKVKYLPLIIIILKVLVSVVTVAIGGSYLCTRKAMRNLFSDIPDGEHKTFAESSIAKLFESAFMLHAAICVAVGVTWLVTAIIYTLYVFCQ